MYLLCLGDPTGSGTASLLTLALNTYKSKVQWVTITIIEFTNPSKNSRHLHVNFQKYYSVQDTHLSESEEKRKEFHDKTNYYLWLVCNDLATVDTWNFFIQLVVFCFLPYWAIRVWCFELCLTHAIRKRVQAFLGWLLHSAMWLPFLQLHDDY